MTVSMSTPLMVNDVYRVQVYYYKHEVKMTYYKIIPVYRIIMKRSVVMYVFLAV